MLHKEVLSNGIMRSPEQNSAEWWQLSRQVIGGRLYKHQLAAVNALRERWAGGGSLLLADDSGLGKSTSFIAFVHSLRCLVSLYCLESFWDS